MKISACIIAKNEENNIARAIESFKNEVDEIIIVDTGSTDRTVEIAKSLGADVYFFEWNGSFSDAKNHALEQATGEWIVFLDADEFFTKETSKNIRKVIKKHIKNKKNMPDTFIFKRDDIDLATGLVHSSGWSQRIFHSSLRYSGSIHEVLVKSNRGQLSARRILEKDLHIYHTGYTKAILASKHDRNHVLLEQLLKKYEELGPDVREIDGEMERYMLHFYLSTSYFQMGDYEVAERYARLFIESGERTLEGDTIPYRVIVACKLHTEKSPEAILKEINIAIEKFPDSPDFRNFRGMVNFRKGLYHQAKNDFDKALKLNEDYSRLDTSQFGYSIGHTYKYLGGIYNHYGNRLEAKSALLKSLKNNINDTENLSFLLRTLQTPNEIEAALDEIHYGETEEQIMKLANTAMSLKMNELISYYLTKLQTFTSLTEEQQARLLFSNRQYDEAFFAYQKLDRNGDNSNHLEVLLIISALLSGQAQLVNTLEDELTAETSKKMLSCLKDGRILPYDQSEKIVMELLMTELGHAEALPLYHIMWLNYISSIKHSAYLFLDSMNEIGYEAFMIDLIQDVLNASNQPDGMLYGKLALLYLRTSDPEKSLLYCAKAIEQGNFDNATIDIAEWLAHLYPENLALVTTANQLIAHAHDVRSNFEPDFSFYLSGRIKRVEPWKVLQAFTD